MLRALEAENFVILEKTALEFGPGFTVLTGETGAELERDALDQDEVFDVQRAQHGQVGRSLRSVSLQPSLPRSVAK